MIFAACAVEAKVANTRKYKDVILIVIERKYTLYVFLEVIDHDGEMKSFRTEASAKPHSINNEGWSPRNVPSVSSWSVPCHQEIQ